MIKNRLSRKKKKPWKLIMLISLFFFSFLFTINCLNVNISNEEFIRLLLAQDNPNIEYSYPKKNIFIQIINFLGNIDLKKPFTMIQNNYVFKDGSVNSSDEDEPTTNTSSQYINDPYPKQEIKDPMVYLYNTHQLEEYKATSNSSYNVTPNVMMTSYILREKLENFGITALVEENNVSEILKINNWNYASSYKVTKLLMEDAKTKNPSLEYFIDLHRDSVSKKVSTTTINDKGYARILFIVGLENPNYQKNLEFTTALNKLFNDGYPGLSRGIYKKEGAGVNGVYNQDFHENTILIEVGGVENTIDEVYNTINAIADVLNKYIKGEVNG